MKTMFYIMIVGFISCSNSEKVMKPTPQKDSLGATGEENIKLIDSRPKVSVFKIDEVDFRLNGFRVGLQDYMKSQSPALTFFRPEMADYIEVLRCTDETSVTVGVNSLSDVEYGTASIAEETKIMQQNDFWSAAEKANGCTLIEKSFSAKELLIDGVAETGSYRYLARACVNKDRIADAEKLSNRNCSRQVAVSPVLNDYKNTRIKEAHNLLLEALDASYKADSLGRAIYYKVIEMNNALVECEKLEAKRVASSQQKKAIIQAVGLGVSFASSVYAGGASTTSGGTFNYTEGFKKAWGDRNQLSGNAGALSSMLSNIFSSASDYPRSCTIATKAKQDGMVLTEQLKAAHETVAVKMEAAKIAKANEQTLEKD